MPPSIPVEISDLENIVREMIFIARKMMPDQISAERLVEAVLQRDPAGVYAAMGVPIVIRLRTRSGYAAATSMPT